MHLSIAIVLRLAACAALFAQASTAAAETAYVSDEQANVIHVIAAPDWQHPRSIPVGRRPRGLELSRDGGRLYVAASNDDRIDIVDLGQGRVVGHLPSGPDP